MGDWPCLRAGWRITWPMAESEGLSIRGVALACSPRSGGNTDLLIDQYVRGMRDAGAEVEVVRVRDMHIESCRECLACSSKGACVIDDDMASIHNLMESSDRIVLATPVFFYQTSSLAGKVIERCQPLWARKYLLDRPIPARGNGVNRRGAWLAVGATRGKKLFDGMRYTARYFFDAMNAELADMVTYRGIDGKGAIRDHTSALQDGYDAGCRFADPSL